MQPGTKPHPTLSDPERILARIPDGEVGVFIDALRERTRLSWSRFGPALAVLCSEHRAELLRSQPRWVRRK